MSAAITFREDGVIELKDLLIFSPNDGFITVEEDADHSLSIEGCTMIFGGCPKWWQIRRWFALLKLVRRYTSAVSDAETDHPSGGEVKQRIDEFVNKVFNPTITGATFDIAGGEEMGRRFAEHQRETWPKLGV
jgi:hypothetical protein